MILSMKGRLRTLPDPRLAYGATGGRPDASLPRIELRLQRGPLSVLFTERVPYCKWERKRNEWQPTWDRGIDYVGDGVFLPPYHSKRRGLGRMNAVAVR